MSVAPSPRISVVSRRALTAFALACLITACATAPPQRNPMAEWHGSPNHNPRRAQMIVLHHTQMQSAQAALQTLRTRNSGGPVSAHYLVGNDGRLYQLVDERERAWHAGAGRWAGIEDINSASIGIELDNDGESPFSAPQIDTLLRLLDDLTRRLGIPRHLIVAHGDIAPTRKRDPSVLFPWKRLADAGFGLWPREPLAPPPPGFDPWAAMGLIGYDLRAPEAAVSAFHRHFRGNEAATWQPGDDAVLYDLQRQLTQRPDQEKATAEPAPSP